MNSIWNARTRLYEVFSFAIYRQFVVNGKFEVFVEMPTTKKVLGAPVGGTATTHKYQPNGKMLCVHCLATSVHWCSKVNFMDLFRHNEYGDLHMADAIWTLKIVGTLSNKYKEGNRNWKRLVIWAIKWH